MTTVTNVTTLIRTDGTQEEIRGYSDLNVHDNCIVWIWVNRVLVIPFHQIKEVVAIEEHSE